MSANTNKKNSSPQPQIRNATDFRTIYVNFAQTAASPMDISLGVGEAGPTNAGIVEVEMKARLVMSPLQAKVVLAMLYQVVQQYEGQFGKIVIPAAVSAQLSGEIRNSPPLKSNDSTEGD